MPFGSKVIFPPLGIQSRPLPILWLNTLGKALHIWCKALFGVYYACGQLGPIGEFL